MCTEVWKCWPHLPASGLLIIVPVEVSSGVKNLYVSSGKWNKQKISLSSDSLFRQSLAVSHFDILLFLKNISQWHVNVKIICLVLLNKCSPGKMSLIFKSHISSSLLFLLIIRCQFTFFHTFLVWDVTCRKKLVLQFFPPALLSDANTYFRDIQYL